jgi:putative thiamine transport system permease protein
MGGGRIATLATEAIALSSGGDRRIAGVYGTVQALAIGAGFCAASPFPMPGAGCSSRSTALSARAGR